MEEHGVWGKRKQTVTVLWLTCVWVSAHSVGWTGKVSDVVQGDNWHTSYCCTDCVSSRTLPCSYTSRFLGSSHFGVIHRAAAPLLAAAARWSSLHIWLSHPSMNRSAAAPSPGVYMRK